MTVIKKEKTKKEEASESVDSLVTKTEKKRRGRPKKVKSEDGESVLREKKEKKIDKKIKEKVNKSRAVEKLNDNVEHPDDEEISIGINIRGKINANVQELIETVEDFGVDGIAGTDKNFDGGKAELKKEVEDAIASVGDDTPRFEKKIAKNAKDIENSVWGVENNAVKKVIASAQLTDTDRLKEIESDGVDDSVVYKKTSRAIGIYKKIAYFFAFLLVVVAAAVFYFTFVRVKIVLIPSQERISNNTIFDILDVAKNKSDDNAGNGKVIGVVRETEVKYSKKYKASKEEILGQEVVGKIRIINNYVKSQPLVASTRLLSADGKLFRLKNTVNAPVNSSVDAEIYADDPSPEMAVGPTKFTIPGLWAGLQDKIYGESTESAEYRQKVKKTVSDDDIKNGIKDLKQELLNNAKKEINDSYGNYDKIIYKIDENSVKSTVEAKVGDEVGEFEISMEAKVVVVAFNNEKFAEIAKDKLIKSLTENKELVSFDSENINYSLNNFDVSRGEANIGASFEGMVTLKSNSDIVDKEKLIGLNKAQIKAYIDETDQINNLELAGYEIKFYPSFFTKIPSLMEPGRIEVEIRK